VDFAGLAAFLLLAEDLILAVYLALLVHFLIE
jgi:hypothetical protein